MFRGSSHCSTSLPSHKRISTMSTQNLPQKDLHRGITTLYWEYTTPLSNTNTSTQEARHKAKVKKKFTTWWSNDHKLSLGDLEGSQTIFSQKQDPKDRKRMIAQVWEKQSILEETTKKNSWEKLLDR